MAKRPGLTYDKTLDKERLAVVCRPVPCWPVLVLLLVGRLLKQLFVHSPAYLSFYNQDSGILQYLLVYLYEL